MLSKVLRGTRHSARLVLLMPLFLFPLAFAQTDGPPISTTSAWVKQKVSEEAGWTENAATYRATTTYDMSTDDPACTWTIKKHTYEEFTSAGGDMTSLAILVIPLWDIAEVSTDVSQQGHNFVRIRTHKSSIKEAFSDRWRNPVAGTDESHTHDSVWLQTDIYFDKNSTTDESDLTHRVATAVRHAGALCANQKPQSSEPF